ncbi:unnamed protein product [Eruca vesicaria subsp. sativa]|uniref:Uncharacterized protein n=1 Tax=Eruca vesicaria subsp. sativa TaxID=29727 RepID=A0ABC8J3G0_ERUVS|nr:unnamed protein product [Eruca vesicaria subsp. sativa]
MERILEQVVSYLKTEIKKKEKKLDHNRKLIKELESRMMFQIENGDLSQTQIDDLKAYLSSRSGTQHPYPSVINESILGDDHDIPKASDDVAPEEGPSLHPKGKGNMEPSDDVDDEMKKTYHQGESSKSGGADDA